MLIDKQTLKDLEIFKTEEGTMAVFDFIDKTKTAGGKYRLREMFLHPPDNLQGVKDYQQSVRYLTENSTHFNMPFTDRQLKSLEAYLSTNIEVVKKNSIYNCAKFCITDVQSYRFLKSSLPEVKGFINGFYEFLDEKKEELPEILKKVVKELESIVNDKRFKTIYLLKDKKAFAFNRVLQVDKLLRTSLKTTLANIIAGYYEADALLAMAKTTTECHFVFPEFTEDSADLFRVEGLYHPLLANAVPCDMKINKDSNVIFLTGPNMSGKTTFLKASGIAIYLAHLGMGIPAGKGQLVYFERLFTSLNSTDNILNGYSFFYSEVKRVKQLAEFLNNGEKIFCLFDELFRGTNVKDAYDATILIISGLVSWHNSSFILSSHLWEVWVKINHFKNIHPLYFESEISNGKPVFTYHLVPGVSDMRLGLTIIENEKIMELLKPPEKC
jgi:DNA mismatch repair protein MutS